MNKVESDLNGNPIKVEEKKTKKVIEPYEVIDLERGYKKTIDHQNKEITITEYKQEQVAQLDEYKKHKAWRKAVDAVSIPHLEMQIATKLNSLKPKQIEEGKRFIDELLNGLTQEHDEMKQKEAYLLKMLQEIAINLTFAKHKL